MAISCSILSPHILRQALSLNLKLNILDRVIDQPDKLSRAPGTLLPLDTCCYHDRLVSLPPDCMWMLGMQTWFLLLALYFTHWTTSPISYIFIFWLCTQTLSHSSTMLSSSGFSWAPEVSLFQILKGRAVSVWNMVCFCERVPKANPELRSKCKWLLLLNCILYTGVLFVCFWK